MKSFLSAYLQTFKDIIANSAILLTIFTSVIIYTFFYPTAYKAQHAESLPIVIVDEDNSAFTNRMISIVSSSPDLDVKTVTSDFSKAKEMVQNEEAAAIVYLPYNLTQGIRNQASSGIVILVSGSYFVQTSTITKGLIATLAGLIEEELKPYEHIVNYSRDIPIHQIPLFNTQGGYGDYIFPAIAPLIIQQTLILGIGMLIIGYRQKKWQPSSVEYLGVFSAFLTIGCSGCLYLFGFAFWLWDYPNGGNFWGMLLAVPIFVCCIAAASMLISSFLDLPERIGHIWCFSSVLLFLLTGVSWPIEAMPVWMQYFTWALPSTHAIRMFLQLNQMGASIEDVMPSLIYLAIFAIISFIWAYFRLVIKPKPAIDHQKVK